MILNSTASPVETALDILNNKWKFLIINELVNGPLRFCKLKNSISGISQKVLVSCLRSLENSNIIIRHEYNEPKLKVEYSLTVLGYSIKPTLDYLNEWGEAYKSTMN